MYSSRLWTSSLRHPNFLYPKIVVRYTASIKRLEHDLLKHSIIPDTNCNLLRPVALMVIRSILQLKAKINRSQEVSLQ